jgi:L-aminopeptidase/D-esterase-like protein
VSQGARPGPRVGDLGIPLGGAPGPLDAITDVAGVQVGHVTLIAGDGPLVVGSGPVRTGVTALLPRGRASTDPVFAGWFSLNGNGEMTGTAWVAESGFLEGPILLTNTHSVGVVHDAVVEWMVQREARRAFALPVVAETYDGLLNDANGFHVRPEHALAALAQATGGPVAEGNVGGGTGMICHEFKGGIGTASRLADVGLGRYTVGVLAQCNYGTRPELRIAGVPVGLEIANLRPCWSTDVRPTRPWLQGWGSPCAEPDASSAPAPAAGRGSIVAIVATDAPLLPHQLERLARRASLGVGKMGGVGANSSGDLFLAFSTANPGAAQPGRLANLAMLPNEVITPLFEATVWATEGAIVNALLAAETMTGADGLRVYALPHERLVDVLRRYHRLAPAP